MTVTTQSRSDTLGRVCGYNGRHKECPPVMYKHCKGGQIPSSVICRGLSLKTQNTFLHSTGYNGILL